MAEGVTVAGTVDPAAGQDQTSLFKEYLAEPRFRIRLDDLVNTNVRVALRLTAEDQFPPNGRIETGQDIAARLRAYEQAVCPLQANAVLLGKWATGEQRPTLANMMARMADNCVKSQSGR